ncbi:DinB family protein [Heyndrickxia sp. NPDC080065]|uniref:DinB family protein n=1 Tax=Heyndrickxia sp. NPDC080065 TaxID=3390568 RepID=UPI003CFF7764
MDLNQRKVWNENHKLLKEIILKPDEHSRAIQLFLSQHALLYSSAIENTGKLTLADKLLINLDEKTFREYPVTNPDTQNSIAWHLWHIARIEDMTMNILVADEQQVLFTGKWLEKMNIEFSHSGNDMSEEDIAELSSRIDFDSLLAYREAVSRQTQKVVSSLELGQFKKKVEQNQIKRLFDENAITQNAKWLAEYWSKKSIAGLILMPATRHNFLHLNKCIRIKNKIYKQMKNSIK